MKITEVRHPLKLVGPSKSVLVYTLHNLENNNEARYTGVAPNIVLYTEGKGQTVKCQTPRKSDAFHASNAWIIDHKKMEGIQILKICGKKLSHKN